MLQDNIMMYSGSCVSSKWILHNLGTLWRTIGQLNQPILGWHDGQLSVNILAGVLQISSNGDNQMGAKIKTQKSLGLLTKPQKIPEQKLTLKYSHAEFPSLKIFQKTLK